MKKYVVLISFLLVGCGEMDRFGAKITGYSKICVDSVTYLQFPSGVTVQVNNMGVPVSCK